MKKLLSFILATAILGASLLCFASCGEEKRPAPDELVVATNAAFEPFEYKEGNLYYGVDIELMAAVAQKLNKKLVIKNMDFDSVIENVNKGYSSVAAAGLTVNEQREKLVTFSDTYYDASQMIIVMANDTTFDACETVADVEAILNAMTSAKKVGVQNGTTGKLYMEGDEDWEFPGYDADVKGYKNAALAVSDMQNGNINFVVVDEGPAKAIAENINATAAADKKVKVIDIKLTEEEYAFAVAKTNTELLIAINVILAEMKADGSFQAIVDKYFSDKGTPTGYKG